MDKFFDKIYNIISKVDIRLFNLSDKKKLSIIAIFSVFIFSIILKLNIMTPLWADDYFYSLSYTGGKILSIKDILSFQYLHYMNNGGRSIVHIIAQILLICPPLIADILNSCVFILFIIVVYIHCKGRDREHNPILFMLIFFSVWFIQPAFGETVLWLTGSANYLWGMCIVVIYLLPYRLYNGKKTRSEILKTIALFLFGIIAGWTNENVSVSLVVMLFLWFIYWKIKSYKIPAWAIGGLIGAILGCCALLLAPGNFVRADFSSTNQSLFAYYYKFNIYTMRFMHNLGYLNIISSILLILVLKFSNLPKKLFLSLIFIYAVGVLAATYSMLASPSFPGRAWFGIITLNIIIFGIIFYNLNFQAKFIRFIRYFILGIVSISFIFNFYNTFKDIKELSIMWHNRDLFIKEAVKENKETVEISLIPIKSKYTFGDDYWNKIDVCNYYGIEVIAH